MGLEAECSAILGGRSARGTALLETDAIHFRGEARATIPLASVKRVVAKGGVLTVEHAKGSASFDLGEQAERWAKKILPPKGRIEKLAEPAPDDLLQALARSPAAKAAFERMPPSHKREHIKYIDEAKRPETRARRIEKTVERLAAGA